MQRSHATAAPPTKRRSSIAPTAERLLIAVTALVAFAADCVLDSAAHGPPVRRSAGVAIRTGIESVPPASPAERTPPPLSAIVETESSLDEEGPQEIAPGPRPSCTALSAHGIGMLRSARFTGSAVGPFVTADRLSRLCRLNC